jgi:hypothetical protein
VAIVAWQSTQPAGYTGKTAIQTVTNGSAN